MDVNPGMMESMKCKETEVCLTYSAIEMELNLLLEQKLNI